MSDGLSSAQEICRHSEELLERADACDRWPTPVEDIVETSKLKEAEDSLLGESAWSQAPKYLRGAIAKLVRSDKLRALLDRRERMVHLDPSITNECRRSFIRLHEVTHDLLPWQQELAFADDDGTLSPATQRLFEREANQGAAELLFQGERFTEIADQYRIGMGAIGELHTRVGSSLRATMRRYAETHRNEVCGMVLDTSPLGFEPRRFRRREVSQSPTWTERFGRTWPRELDEDAFPFLTAVPRSGVLPIEDLVFAWPDLNNEPVQIHAGAIETPYAILLLLWIPRRETFKRKRTFAVAGQAG